jgi:hypothetical protein
MHAAHTNKPEGRRFSEEMALLLKKSPKCLACIDNSTRSRVLECLANKDAILKYLAMLPENVRVTLNHPNAVLRHWRKHTQVPKPDDTSKPPSPVAKLKQALIDS